jgi:hypothetical protein
MSAQQWQVTLDQSFPDGANVTLVADVPQGGDENPTYLVPRLIVTGVSDDDMPRLWSLYLGLDKDLVIVVEEILNESQGLFDVEDEIGQRWLITDNLEPGSKILLEAMYEDHHFGDLSRVWPSQEPSVGEAAA